MSALLVFAVVPADRIEASTLADGDGLPPGLRAIAVDGLAAVVGAAPEGGLKGRERGALLPWLLASQKVMERLLASAAVLPVALGSVVEDDDRVRHLLSAGADVLRPALVEMDGRCEMDLSVRWSGTGAAFDALERQAMRRLLVAAVRKAVCDLIVTEPAEAEAVVALSVLLDRGGEPELMAVLDALDTAGEGRLSFRLVGPLAPYSFAAVQIHLAPVAALAVARAELSVDPGATAETVKTAYRRALRHVHPDLVASGRAAVPGEGAGGDADGFLALSGAYRALQGEWTPVSLRRQDTALV